MKNKLIKFVACGDNHGDHGDSESIAALLAYCDAYSPDIKIHLGDCFDLRALDQVIPKAAKAWQPISKAASDFFGRINPIFIYGVITNTAWIV